MPRHRRLALVVILLTAAALPGQQAIAAQSEMVIARKGTGQGEKHYHRPGCPVVRDGKGQVDRVTVLPARARAPLVEQVRRVEAIHAEDCAAGLGRVQRRNVGVDPVETHLGR